MDLTLYMLRGGTVGKDSMFYAVHRSLSHVCYLVFHKTFW
jgi:hypothetical protein